MQHEWVLPCCYRGTISRNAATLLGTNRAGSNGSVQLEGPGAVVIEDHAMLLTMPHVPMLSLRANGFSRCGVGNANNRQVSLPGQPPEMWENFRNIVLQIGSLAARRSLPIGIVLIWLLHNAPGEENPLSHKARLNHACLTGGDIDQGKPDHALVAFTDRSEVLRTVDDRIS